MRTRNKRSCILPAALIADFCAICLRTEDELDPDEHFEVHHIIPRQYGGPDRLINYMVVCSTCHKEIHIKHRQTEDEYGEPTGLNFDNRRKLQAYFAQHGID